MGKKIAQFISDAEAGRIVRLSDVTAAFANDPEALPVSVTVALFDGSERQFGYRLPHWENEKEHVFALELILAYTGNLLSALGGSRLTYAVPADAPELKALLTEAEAMLRSGDGHTKPVRVIDRINAAYGNPPFSISVEEAAAKKEPAAAQDKRRGGFSLAEHLRRTEARAEKGIRMGIDIGGTDIKAAVYRDGTLVAVKEYDWDPGRSPDAEGMIAPIVTIARLLRCAVALDAVAYPELSSLLTGALKKDALPETMDTAVRQIEAACAPETGLADSIGVSFPDVVLNDRIAGGETPKTRGIRLAQPEQYEAEFKKLAALNERLMPVLKPGGAVRMTNDGNVAAYTAAVELAHGDAPEFVEKGVLAHSLGTDFGTGYLLPDGTFPFMPLEFYDSRIDLGSIPQKACPSKDLRGTRNENSGLPGARRYLGQSAAFRMLWERAPGLMRDYVEEKNGILTVKTEPEDLRKPLLAHIMALADAGDPEAEAVFVEIGENLGTISHEVDAILQPETDTRLIFGRFVKSSRCFELIRQGCAKTFPGLVLAIADESIANTALMRALASRPELSVAQFGQAVGAAVFGAEER